MRSIPAIAAVVVLMVAPATAAAEKFEPRTFRWKNKEAGHLIEIVISEKAFDRKQHKIDPGFGNEAYRIDGVGPWGSDGQVPASELAAFSVKWDGKDVPVPAKLWKDCYNLGITPYEEPAVVEPGDEPFVKISEDGRYAMFTFYGGDGAGAYAVTWILSREGRHSRWIMAF